MLLTYSSPQGLDEALFSLRASYQLWRSRSASTITGGAERERLAQLIPCQQ